MIGVVAGGIVFYRKRSKARSTPSFQPSSGGGAPTGSRPAATNPAPPAPVPPPYSSTPPKPISNPPIQSMQRTMPSNPYPQDNLGITIEDDDTITTVL